MVKYGVALIATVLFSVAVYGAEPPKITKEMPPVVVLITCRSELTGQVDQNDKATHHQDRDWTIIDGKMSCRRLEVEVYNQGNPAAVLTLESCPRVAVKAAMNWDVDNESKPWRVWRTACPTPVVRTNPDGSEEIIDWVLPDCGHRDVVRCDVDTEI